MTFNVEQIVHCDNLREALRHLHDAQQQQGTLYVAAGVLKGAIIIIQGNIVRVETNVPGKNGMVALNELLSLAQCICQFDHATRSSQDASHEPMLLPLRTLVGSTVSAEELELSTSEIPQRNNETIVISDDVYEKFMELLQNDSSNTMGVNPAGENSQTREAPAQAGFDPLAALAATAAPASKDEPGSLRDERWERMIGQWVVAEEQTASEPGRHPDPGHPSLHPVIDYTQLDSIPTPKNLPDAAASGSATGSSDKLAVRGASGISDGGLSSKRLSKTNVPQPVPQMPGPDAYPAVMKHSSEIKMSQQTARNVGAAAAVPVNNGPTVALPAPPQEPMQPPLQAPPQVPTATLSGLAIKRTSNASLSSSTTGNSGTWDTKPTMTGARPTLRIREAGRQLASNMVVVGVCAALLIALVIVPPALKSSLAGSQSPQAAQAQAENYIDSKLKEVIPSANEHE